MAAIDRPRVFLDVQIGTEPAGRLVIELFVDKTPKTCENFRALSTGELGHGLTYKNSPFHRVIDEFMVQGGDITKGDGTGGKSIYGADFEDENIGWREIDKEGLLCMANRGKGTNSSQFFITLAPCEHLNAKHTVFGTVVSGQPVLERMAKLKVDKNDRPYDPVLVAQCGELERRKKPLTQSTNKETMVKATKELPSRRRRSPFSDVSDRGRKRRRGESDIEIDRATRNKRLSHGKDHARPRHSRSLSPKQSAKNHYRKSSNSCSRSPLRKHRRRSPSHDSNLRGRSPVRSASRTASLRSPSPPPARKRRRSESRRTRSPTPTPRRTRSRSLHRHHPHRRRTRSPSPSPPPRRRYRSRSRSRSNSPGSRSEDRHRRRYARDHRPHRHHDRHSWRSDHYSASYYEDRRPDEDRIRREEEEREGLSGRYEGVIAEDEDRGDNRGRVDLWDRREYMDGDGSGRLGGGGADVGGEGKVKFKGRGSMKYRERRW